MPAWGDEATVPGFRPYVNMVRPIDDYDGVSRTGTIENSLGMLCKNERGVFIGMIINVRTNKLMTSVLMPAFDTETSLVAYLNFLENDEEKILLHKCQFAEDKRSLTAEKTMFEACWPKKDVSFDLKSDVKS